jgi:hypothetical protein
VHALPLLPPGGQPRQEVPHGGRARTGCTAGSPERHPKQRQGQVLLLDEAMTPGGEFVAEELIVQVIPQAEEEFTCYPCFLVRHRSQLAREKNGHPYCMECEG